MTELVGQQAALEQPPGFVAFLGQNKAIAVERRRQLLQAAVIRRPADLSVLMTLGETYPINQKGRVDESYAGIKRPWPPPRQRSRT